MENGRATECRSIDSHPNGHPSDLTSILHPPSILGSRLPAPRLLVSVRNAAEARAALTGGCDILDVKEPSRGALGMADREVIQQVLAVSPARQSRPVTAALGEAREWLKGCEDKGLGSRRMPERLAKTPAASVPVPIPSQHLVPRWPAAIPAGVSLVKLGLAGLGESDWQTRWREARDRADEAACRKLRWIAVAYADWQSAAAPAPHAVVDAAITAQCAGVLFDTYHKDGRHLLDHFERQASRAHRQRRGLDRLQPLTERIQASGLLVALAGSLTIELLPEILQLRPDVIAIRGAACVNRNRTGAVSAAAVDAFRRTMAAARPIHPV